MNYLAWFLYMTLIVNSLAQGRVVFEGAVFSETLGTNRTVRIYLPPSYQHAPDRHFPVLYVHDGQNAFTTVGPHGAFGWGNWALDQTVTELIYAGRMEQVIVVAIDCSAQRYQDYRGPVAPGKTNTHYERYKKFLITELKPKIDREYRTLTDAANTGVMGSSMGGICSLALAWEHPEIFGQAASLSGAFQVEQRHLLNELKRYNKGVKAFRVYLDSGVVDYSGGDDGRKNTDAVAAELQRIGWREGKNFMHYVDEQPLNEAQLTQTDLPRHKWGEAQTSQHNEFYWRIRAWRALTFLFPKKQGAQP